MPGCLVMSFFNVICFLLASALHALVPGRVGSVAKCQEGGSCLLVFPAAEGEYMFCFLFFGLVSLGPVFTWVTAGIDFLMLRSCICLFIDSVRCCILEQK